jgi:putative lipoic acid-binding regulatory protein
MHTGTMNGEPPERLEFPCAYPIKVMVRAQQGVRSEVDAIMEKYAAPLDRSAVVERASSQKNFLGITYVINAKSPEQIAELFAALKRCPHVMLVL